MSLFFGKTVTLPKRVVDFPWERDTFRNKTMEIVVDFDEKKKRNNNNGKPWKSCRILRLNTIFSFLFLFFHLFSSIFTFFFFFIFFHFLSCSFMFFHVLFFLSLSFICSSSIIFSYSSFLFIFFHVLYFSVIFFHFSVMFFLFLFLFSFVFLLFFFFLSGASISLRFLLSFFRVENQFWGHLGWPSFPFFPTFFFSRFFCLLLAFDIFFIFPFFVHFFIF